MGDIDGLRITNSLEALRCNYKRGFRWFDVDVSITADGELVCIRKGNERRAGLPQRVADLPVAEVEGKLYAQRFPITRLSTLLQETDRLGDVVLVLDTGGWSARVEQALSRTLGYGPKHATRIVLQVSAEMDVKSITTLSQEIGASVVVKLRGLKEDDAKVEALVKKASPLAVVASNERFTPWLAQRLHALQTPLLVSAVNEHADVARLTLAGADGFYTDRYLPFGALTSAPSLALGCGNASGSALELQPWTRRELRREEDVELPECAERRGKRAELRGCASGDVLATVGLPVPRDSALSLEVDAQAGPAGARYWVEVLEELEAAKVLRPREEVLLKAGERRTLKLHVSVPGGSPAVQARLGLASDQEQLTLHRLRLERLRLDQAGRPAAAIEPTLPQAETDAGD